MTFGNEKMRVDQINHKAKDKNSVKLVSSWENLTIQLGLKGLIEK